MNKEHSKAVHDINSSLSALISALELINDEWKDNRELVERIVPLTLEKWQHLQISLSEYYNNQ